jgi:hypothetical protein
MYGIVSLPAKVVEPTIALSIAYVAIENLVVSELKPWRLALVFSFGLLHGMGFAGVLRDLGLPRPAFLTALVSFNVGVEAGQLSVIAIAFVGCAYGSTAIRLAYRRVIVVPASVRHRADRPFLDHSARARVTTHGCARRPPAWCPIGGPSSGRTAAGDCLAAMGACGGRPVDRLILVRLTVSATGGFRLRFGDWRFALTSSPARCCSRSHRRLRPPSARPRSSGLHPRRSRCALDEIRRAANGRIRLRGIASAIFFAGLLAVVMIGYPPGTPPWRDYDNELMNLPLRWDAGWYLQIAENSYRYFPRRAPGRSRTSSFPAYPMVTRAVALLLGNQKTAYVGAGTLVSLAAFLFALAYLHAFARDEIGDERAPAALWLLAAYPFALFFGALYTESLYLLAALGAFHHFRRREFVRAGAWGLVIGLTRPNGGLLSVPLAMLALSPWIPIAVAGGRAVIRSPGARRLREVAPALAAASTCALGTLLYSAFSWRMTGSPVAWASGHAAWGRHYTSLTRLVATRYDVIGHAGLYNYVAQSPCDMLNVLGAAFVLAAVWPVWRFGIAFALFILINIMPPLTTGGFLSAGRFSSVLFPAFIGWPPSGPRQRTAWIVSFAMLQALCAALFYLASIVLRSAKAGHYRTRAFLIPNSNS